ncbi:sensor histidine kinase [Paenibacillus prosopidis]|uniref:Two-component system sensor histidine kinase YesM n=1 Tax=Paenibacillus prosopidis TaxID=630520 RepID=A0A368W756_9BACL|nr:histidine kinase [Paenibacillus prosopidis]RCW49012.1 two-component system sensor histidine kinase YesM [Paenibacillus prosopidis]
MRGLSDLSRLHVYQKVIIVFVAMMLPVYLINLWMNMSGVSFMKKGFSDSILSNVQFYSNQLNDQFTFVRTLQLQLINDPDLLKLSFLGGQLNGFDDYQLVNRLRDRLFTVRDSSDYLANVGVYVNSFGRTISTQGGIAQLPNSEYSLISRYTEQKPPQPIYYDEGRLFFIETANNGSIVVYMELSSKNLEATVSNLVKLYHDSGALLVDGRQNSAISVMTGGPILNEMKAAIAKRGDAERSVDSYMLTANKQNYMVAQTHISALGLTLYTYMNQNEVTEPLKRFNAWFTVLSFVSLAIVIMFSYSVNLMIHKPLKKLIRAFKNLETDNLIVSLQQHGDNEFSYLYENFDRMVLKLRHSIHENYEQQIALQHSELKQLQSQINPHFLYNSFFNIYMICRSGDLDSASTLAQKLGSYYQFITRSGREEVTLDEEYRHALDYCDIQGIRFSNRIEVEAEELPELCKPLEVPRLIIQPLVENAFEHAFESGARRGNIYMKAAFTGGILSISVEDDGSTMTDESLLEMQDKLDHVSQLPEKTGLLNVCRRIQLRFGEQSGVFVSRSSLGGLKAEIRIHYEEGEQHVPDLDRR